MNEQQSTLTSKDVVDSTEEYYAEMESARNLALDAYFISRPQLLRTHADESIFRAGFERAFSMLWNRPHTHETLLQLSDPTSKEAINLDLENVQTQLDAMTRKYERLAAAAKNYVATGSGSSAIYEAMEDEANELKAFADPYKAVCQGGTGGKCCQPDCEICWPDPPPLNGL